MLSLTTDWSGVSTGSPEPALRGAAEAGFTHVHWCHQWNTDFVYAAPEVDQIGRWLGDLGLRLLDLHASAGVEKAWGSPREWERLAGVELVHNRLEMTARLGGDAVVMHLPDEPPPGPERAAHWDRMRRTLDALAPTSRATGVRVALENLGPGSFDALERAFALQGPDVLGLCYDAGHGHATRDGLDRLERLLDRLAAVHLHDNDGAQDLHRLPFDGTLDWARLARLLARSPYAKPLSFESNMRTYEGVAPAEFLARAFTAGSRLAAMVAAARATL